MKKRAAAAILGILLSVSMGLEVPAAALDGGFTSGFTSEADWGSTAARCSGGRTASSI